jgi:hypothetical protein
VVLVRAFYRWPVFTPDAEFLPRQYGEQQASARHAAAFRNEPYTTTTGGADECLPALRKKAFKLVRRAAATRIGAAAVEFAMLLPIMITLFFGVVETSLALLCRADVSIMASTAADLISQADDLATGDISNVYSAAGTPFSIPTMIRQRYRQADHRHDQRDLGHASAKRHGRQSAWTCTQSGSAPCHPASRSVAAHVTLPQALLTHGSSVIVSEIAYSYASPTTKVVTGSINFTNNFYTKPRRVAQIPSPTGGCPLAPRRECAEKTGDSDKSQRAGSAPLAPPTRPALPSR